MKIQRTGLVWFLIVGMPALVVCFVGIAASLMGWTWLIQKCTRYIEEVNG